MLILKPSNIQGVGVFTTRKIRVGENPFIGIPDDSFLHKKVSNPQKRYCIYEDRKGWWGPKDFTRMAIWWYLNHSKNPNIDTDTWKAIKPINGGKELTINYNKL